MEPSSAKVQSKTSAAYLPFSTLLTALDHLKAVTVPNEIEAGTFRSLSGQARNQIISAFKFFGLIDEGGAPQPDLYALIENEADRKKVVKKLIEKHYPDIVALDFAKITANQLDDKLSGERYNISGETKKKAKTFLLKAAQYAGFTVHPNLTKITRNRKSGGSKKVATPKAAIRESGSSIQPPPLNPDAVRMPIPLSPDRTAYVELPKDWTPQDAKKLLALLKLSLDVND